MRHLARDSELRVADEAWIATALLHREHPERADFAVSEILDRASAEHMTEFLRPGVGHHVSYHGVANKPPNPGQYRMLYETSHGRRRLFREGDPADPKRRGKIVPETGAIPPKYRHLLDWYRNEYGRSQARGWLSGIKEMVGAGREIFDGVDPDDYVRQLREGWE